MANGRTYEHRHDEVPKFKLWPWWIWRTADLKKLVPNEWFYKAEVQPIRRSDT